MTLRRREFLKLGAGTAALPLLSRAAPAQSYPTRPVRLLVGYAAGGPGDALVRLTGQWLWGGSASHSSSKTDREPGRHRYRSRRQSRSRRLHTLYVSPANAINAALYPKLNFDFIRDTAPVSGLVRVANLMVVHPSLPVTTVPEFIAYAKSHPGKLSRAVGGIGTSGHLAGELFNMMAGIDLVLVPYRGGAPAITDLLIGRVHVYLAPCRGPSST